MGINVNDSSHKRSYDRWAVVAVGAGGLSPNRRNVTITHSVSEVCDPVKGWIPLHHEKMVFAVSANSFRTLCQAALRMGHAPASCEFHKALAQMIINAHEDDLTHISSNIPARPPLELVK